jgi:hypothetical protein
MWRTNVVGLALIIGTAAIAQTTGQPKIDTPTINAQTPAGSTPTVRPQSPGAGGQPTVNAPTPGVAAPTARPSTPRTNGPTVNLVDCGNGNTCPSGNSCLLDGMCAPLVEMGSVAGATRTSVGGWCLPGFHENQYSPGKCVSNGRVDCAGGLSCGPGATCDGNGGCRGVTPSGPICDPADPRRCEDSSFSCSSRGACIEQGFRECANGRICPRQSACSLTGCAMVGPTRTAQVPRSAPPASAATRDDAMAKCHQLAGSLATFRQGMGEAWYVEQLGKSSCKADGTPQ